MEEAARLDHLGPLEYRKMQLTALVILRVLIGWHFLYEGFVKVINPYWSAGGYLSESKWIFRGFFHWIADTPTLLSIVDFVNEWGLILVGLGLILGLFTRPVTIAGMILVFMYWLCNPPFIGYTYSMPPEGSYIIVNKTLIEAAALFVLVLFPTGKQLGLDRLIFLTKKTS
jgi:thiosulfate dehydrogenase [quinone] large subunit